VRFLERRPTALGQEAKREPATAAGSPMIFIHGGYQHYPAYTFLHAAEQGFDVHVIADRSWSTLRDVTFHDINQFAPAAEAFRSVYTQRSPHQRSYEMFCFERWFVLGAFASRHGLDAFVCADSDLLIFPGWQAIFDVMGQATMTDTAWFNVFRSRQALTDWTEFILHMYRTGADEAAAAKYPHGLSDMTCLYEYGALNPAAVSRWRHWDPLAGFDLSLVSRPPFRANPLGETINAVVFTPDGPAYVSEASGDAVPMRTLHFQGKTKAFIQAYHAIREPRHLAQLRRLSGWLGERRVDRSLRSALKSAIDEGDRWRMGEGEREGNHAAASRSPA